MGGGNFWATLPRRGYLTEDRPEQHGAVRTDSRGLRTPPGIEHPCDKCPCWHAGISTALHLAPDAGEMVWSLAPCKSGWEASTGPSMIPITISGPPEVTAISELILMICKGSIASKTSGAAIVLALLSRYTLFLYIC